MNGEFPKLGVLEENVGGVTGYSTCMGEFGVLIGDVGMPEPDGPAIGSLEPISGGDSTIVDRFGSFVVADSFLSRWTLCSRVGLGTSNCGP